MISIAMRTTKAVQSKHTPQTNKQTHTHTQHEQRRKKGSERPGGKKQKARRTHAKQWNRDREESVKEGARGTETGTTENTTTKNYERVRHKTSIKTHTPQRPTLTHICT